MLRQGNMDSKVPPGILAKHCTFFFLAYPSFHGVEE